MPVPQILIGVVTGSLGVVSTLKNKRDRKRYERARKSYEEFFEGYCNFVNRVNNELYELHNLRVEAQKTLRETANWLKPADVKERTFSVGPNVIPWNFVETRNVIEQLSTLATGIAGGAAAGAALGGAAAAGTYAAVGVVGTASTGAAISGLTGIAARNATLAWLGGGTLATGGGGMGAGMVNLVGIALAPAAAVPVLVNFVQAMKQGKRVDSEIHEMNASRAKMDKHAAELTVVLNRVHEVSKSIHEVATMLRNLLASASTSALEDVYRVACAAKRLAQLLDLDEASESAS